MNNLTVTLVQQVIVPNDPEHNLEVFSQSMAAIANTDLIVLPEVFTTGFCASARSYAEVTDGRAYQWMRPDGSYTEYNKRHLFRMAGEHTRYAMGNERVLVEVKGWRVLPLICYDLRFPVWSRNRNDYDLSLYVANWPSVRSLHWNRLLQARAIENLSYTLGVNRVGMDEAGQHYAGDSSVYGPAGELIATSQEAELITVELYAERLTEYRERFPAYLDADDFEIKELHK